MSQYTIDHVKRMKQIKATLDSRATDATAVQQKEDMLDELLDIVDNIDYARGGCHNWNASGTVTKSSACPHELFRTCFIPDLDCMLACLDCNHDLTAVSTTPF